MSEVFRYKNYLGSIETSVEDLCLHGKILHINDLITYEAQTPAKLKKAFEEAVDDYLQLCRQQKKEPEKPFKGSLNIRIGSELHKNAAYQATLNNISINEYIKNAVEAKLNLEKR